MQKVECGCFIGCLRIGHTFQQLVWQVLVGIYVKLRRFYQDSEKCTILTQVAKRISWHNFVTPIGDNSAISREDLGNLVHVSWIWTLLTRFAKRISAHFWDVTFLGHIWAKLWDLYQRFLEICLVVSLRTHISCMNCWNSMAGDSRNSANLR